MAKIDHRTCAADIVTDARQLYEAYIRNCDGLAWDGRPCPTWDDLLEKGTSVPSHWCAAVIESRALAHYRELLASGLSDAEARGTAWPA